MSLNIMEWLKQVRRFEGLLLWHIEQREQWGFESFVLYLWMHSRHLPWLRKRILNLFFHAHDVPLCFSSFVLQWLQKEHCISENLSIFNMYGHPTGIWSTALLSDDELACTISMNNTRIWNVGNCSCVHSTSPSLLAKSKKGVSAGCYRLSAMFFAWELTCST
jgi:hypothetical protein